MCYCFILLIYLKMIFFDYVIWGSSWPQKQKFGMNLEVSVLNNFWLSARKHQRTNSNVFWTWTSLKKFIASQKVVILLHSVKLYYGAVCLCLKKMLNRSRHSKPWDRLQLLLTWWRWLMSRLRRKKTFYSQLFRPITTARLQVGAEKSGMFTTIRIADIYLAF